MLMTPPMQPIAMTLAQGEDKFEDLCDSQVASGDFCYLSDDDKPQRQPTYTLADARCSIYDSPPPPLLDGKKKSSLSGALSKQKGGFLEDIRGLGYNVLYKINEYSYGKAYLYNIKSQIVLFGETFGGWSCQTLKDANALFLERFSNIVWFTYRKHFDAVDKEQKLYSDIGWGCVVRVGQMMLCEALRRLGKLGPKEAEYSNMKYTGEIVSLFLDKTEEYGEEEKVSHDMVPFSLHKIVDYAAKDLKMKAGEWFKSSTVCFILQKLYSQYYYQGDRLLKALLPNIEIITEFEACIYMDKLESVGGFASPCATCDSQRQGKPQRICREHKPIILFICCMLSLEVPTPEVLSILKELLQLPSSIGMIGGTQSQGLYIVGYQDDNFVILDPHYVQRDISAGGHLESFFCASPLLFPSSRMSSTCTLGFLLQNRLDFLTFQEACMDIKKRHKEHMFLSICEKESEVKGPQSLSASQKAEVVKLFAESRPPELI